MEAMTELLTYTPGPPVNAANLIAVVTDFHIEQDRNTEAHTGYTVEELDFRAKAMTPTLREILDFHPTSHPELP